MSSGNAESSYADAGRDGDGNCRYKGVVHQQNGNWGAQIYAKQSRIWLGTFKTERDAAMAYDSAAIRLRSGDSFRNIDSDPESASLEAEFQGRYSTEEVLNMIKDGSYQSTLVEFRRNCNCHPQQRIEGYGGNDKCTKLFEKELTTSDVGKLNRFVVPKKFAKQFFPRLREEEEDQETELEFLDSKMKRWKFRYCYWKSSQSYVFTKGWNKFVKDKNLQAKDAVVFYVCQTEEGDKFFKIDFRIREATTSIAVEVVEQATATSSTVEVERRELVGGERKMIRLFGVDIPCDL